MASKLIDNTSCEFNYMPGRKRIYLDDQELDRVSSVLLKSLRQRIIINAKLYHPFEHLEVIGVVDRIDRTIGRFKVDGEWFILGDIEGVDVG